MKKADEEALMAAARFVVRLGRVHALIDEQFEREAIGSREGMWVEQFDVGSGGQVRIDDGEKALEDPRRTLGEHYHRLAVLVADLEGEG